MKIKILHIQFNSTFNSEFYVNTWFIIEAKLAIYCWAEVSWLWVDTSDSEFQNYATVFSSRNHSVLKGEHGWMDVQKVVGLLQHLKQKRFNYLHNQLIFIPFCISSFCHLQRILLFCHLQRIFQTQHLQFYTQEMQKFVSKIAGSSDFSKQYMCYSTKNWKLLE